MAELNKVLLIGRLTRDPSLHKLPSGTAKCDMRLASDRKRKDKDGDKQKEVCFIDVTVWGRQAEVCKEHLAKGREVLVEGHLRYSEWETDDGQKRSKHEVVADWVTFLGGPSGKPRAQADEQEPEREPGADEEPLGDLPF